MPIGIDGPAIVEGLTLEQQRILLALYDLDLKWLAHLLACIRNGVAVDVATLDLIQKNWLRDAGIVRDLRHQIAGGQRSH